MDFTSTNTNFFPKVDPDDAYYRYFHSKGGANELSGGYANPAADKLLEEGEATVDTGKRAEAYRRLVQLLDDEVPVVTTGLGDAAIGWRTPVKGFEPHIIGLLAYPGGGLPNAWLDALFGVRRPTARARHSTRLAGLRPPEGAPPRVRRSEPAPTNP
jgi:hypothetical protein